MKGLFCRWMILFSGLLLLLPVVSDAQQVPVGGLRIVAPPDGTVVEPGQPFTIVVEPDPGVTPTHVGLVSPLLVALKEEPPFTFTETFPPDAPLGPERVVATGLDEQERPLRAELTLHIETAIEVTSIRVTMPPFFIATKEEISVFGTFADGVRREITRSREIAYSSSNTAVATVSSDGRIEAVDNGTATITVTYKNQSFSFPVRVDFTPQDRLPFICARLQGIIGSNRGTALADKVEDAHAKCETGVEELSKTAPDEQAAVGNLEGAVGDLQVAVHAGLLDPTHGGKFMEHLARTARQLAVAALEQAVAQGGDPVILAAAEQALAEGDQLRTSGLFTTAVNKYKDALAKAQSALGS